MRRLGIGTWLGLVLIAVLAPAASAQPPATPADRAPADREVRVSYDCLDGVCYRVVGRLAGVTPDSLVVDGGPRGLTAVPRAKVDRVEVRRPGLRGVAKGALIGIGAGALVGVGASAAWISGSGIDCKADVGESCLVVSAQAGAIGAGLGLVIGSIIGAATGGSGWTVLPLDSLVAPDRGRGDRRSARR